VSVRLLVVAGAAALLLLAVAVQCSGPQSLTVRPPDGAPGDPCTALHAALPEQVNGEGSRPTRPDSDRTAAWGDPAVVLRCGESRPAGLRPTSEVIEVEGVGWFLTERTRTYVFTTVGRPTYVEMRVPTGIPREQATSPLVDVAAAIREHVPVG